MFYHNLTFDRYVLQSPVRGYRIKKNVVFLMNTLFDILHSFLMKSFISVH